MIEPRAALRLALASLGGALVAAIACVASIGCSASPTGPPVVAPDPVAPAPDPPAPAPSAEPVALPFHLPCAADDAVGCTNACNDNFVEDCVTLGAMYLSGGSVSIDRERAVELFRRACGRDSARGCMRIADAYHSGFATPAGDASPQRDPHAEEVLFYRRACDGGANQGCVLAGRALVAGHGVTRDPASAAKLFAPVCDRGNADGCLELGKLFKQGDGVKRDVERASSLFLKACNLGQSEGCVLGDPARGDRHPRKP